MARRATMLALSAGMVMITATPAGAQTAVPAPEARNDDLGEIVVTARRQAENLERVPLSASVFDAATLDSGTVSGVRDMQYLAPSLNVSTNTNRNADNYALRGQGTTFGTDPAVVAYFAEVPMPGGGGGSGMLFDLANVQVLNGPQGTLFGRNTTGGAILFEPQRPTTDIGGYVRLGYGSYNNFEQEGVVNLPLASSKVLFRAGVSHRTRDGFTRDVGTGQRYDDIDYLAARASLLLRPVDGFENYTLLNYTNRDENGVGTKLASINPQSPIGFVFGQAAAAAVAEQMAIGPRQTRLGASQRERQRVLTLVNRTTINLTDDVTLKNIASYTRFRSAVTFDNDGSALPIVDYIQTPGWGGPQNNSAPAIDQFTEELQLAGTSFAKALSWSIGGYYQHNDPKDNLTAQRVFGGPVVLSRIGDELTSKAAFGQATIDFGVIAPSLEGLKLTGGLRYTHDRRKDYTETYLQTGGSFAGGGVCAYIAGSFPNCRVTFAPRTYQATTYTGALSYETRGGSLLYVTARSGFKSGGFNLGAPPVSALNSFGPEKVDDIEIGVKTRIRVGGVDLRLSVAAFRDKYRDIQRALVADFGGGVGVYVTNATRATIKGVEVRADAALTRGVTLSVDYSHLESKYGSFVSPQGDFTGFPLPYTPRDKVAVTAAYDRDLGNVGKLALRATYAYQGSYRNLDAFDPDIVIGSYDLLNLSVGLRNVASVPLDLTLFANNVANRTYRIGGGNYYYTLGYTTAVYGEPRTIGVRATYHFGS